MSILDIVNDFNDGDLDVENLFNDYETFFNILKRRGMMSLINPSGRGSEDWQNEYLIWLYDNDRQKFYKDVVKLLNNDLIIDDTGKIFYETNNRSDLAALFCSNRNDMSQDTIESILSGESDWEPYWDTTDDVYRDVIEELTPENNKSLQEYIVNKLKDTKIEPETEELELIASEQGHPEYVMVTLDNTKRIVDNKETMEYLFENGLEDLESELKSIHSSSYNSAYESAIWKVIWNELETYFNGNGQWISRPHTYKKDTTVEIFRIPVADNFDTIILEYLNDNKTYGNSGTLEYQGSYLSVLREFADCLSAYSPDYPDSSEVDENINLYFSDYI